MKESTEGENHKILHPIKGNKTQEGLKVFHRLTGFLESSFEVK